MEETVERHGPLWIQSPSERVLKKIVAQTTFQSNCQQSSRALVRNGRLSAQWIDCSKTEGRTLEFEKLVALCQAWNISTFHRKCCQLRAPD